MGDKILKKTTLFIALSCLLFAGEKKVDLAWVEKEIGAIKQPRKGVAYKTISLLKDPFVFLEKNKKTKSTAKKILPSVASSTATTSNTKPKDPQSKKLELMAIINNSVLINNKWYKIGENIGEYKIIKVTLNAVTLKSPNNSLVLTTYTKKQKNRMIK